MLQWLGLIVLEAVCIKFVRGQPFSEISLRCESFYTFMTQTQRKFQGVIYHFVDILTCDSPYQLSGLVTELTQIWLIMAMVLQLAYGNQLFRRISWKR
jgi:hypothetical protein